MALKMLGMHGAYAANMVMTHSDLILAVGARFDDRVTGKIATFAPHAKIIHIDVDPTSIRKNVRVDLPIVGDTKDVLVKMIECLNRLGRDVEIVVRKAPRSHPHGQTQVVFA